MDTTLLRQHLRRAGIRRELPPPHERRRIRDASGLSQREIAEVLNVTQVTVSRWETGERDPSPAYAVEYAQLLRYLADSMEVVA